MDKDPKPLKASGGTPIELQRALHALRRTDDAARLARVAERLGATIAASSTPAASGLGTMTGTKIGLIGLAVSLGVAGVIGYSLLADRPAPAVKRPAAPAAVEIPAPAAAPAVEMPAVAAAQPAAAAQAPADPIAPATAEPVPVREPRRARRAATRSPAPPHAARARATEAPSIAAAAAPATSSAAAPVSPKTPAAPEASLAEASNPKTPAAPEASAAEPNKAEPVQPTPQPVASLKPAAQSPVPATRSSEAALLHEARKVASRQPETALRLIDEHARRFPSGVLVPERELLAIEVLRRLDRDAEAEQRLRRFEARYPRSIHLRRLERESSTEPR